MPDVHEIDAGTYYTKGPQSFVGLEPRMNVRFGK